MPDPLKERISLLTVGEAQGKLRPEHKAELERYRQQGMMPGPKPAAGGKQPLQAIAKGQNLAALAKQFAEVKGRYDRDLKGVGPASILEYLPLPRNRAFDKAATGLSEVAMAAFRVPGAGAQSDADAARMAAAFQPKASDSDEEIEAKLQTLRNRLEQAGVTIPGERRAQFKVIR